MTSVWIVTSDYCDCVDIEGVYATEALADAHADALEALYRLGFTVKVDEFPVIGV